MSAQPDPTYDMPHLSRTALAEAIPNKRELTTDCFTVEYGSRLDDSVMVFHFFPPETGWDHKRVRDALDRGLIDVLATRELWSKYKAEFVPELDSYVLRVPAMGSAPDPDYCAKLFLNAVVAAL